MEHEIVRHMDGIQLNIFVATMNHRFFHFHKDLELIMVLEGSICVDCGKNKYVLQKNDIIILNKNEMHSVYKTKEDNVILALQFDQNICENYYPKIKNIKFTKYRISRETDGALWTKVAGYIFEMVSSYICKKEGYSINLVGVINSMLYTFISGGMYEVLDEKSVAAESKNTERLNHIMEYMQNNFMYKITLKKIAEEEKLDMFYLSHFIKSHLGITFQQYLNHLRTERAEYLLKNTDMNNTEICMECGFSDYKYMVSYFKEEFGMTPARYKKRNCGENKSDYQMKSDADQHKIMNSREAVELLREYFKKANEQWNISCEI